jgi:CRP-like cAMP-binding protein
MSDHIVDLRSEFSRAKDLWRGSLDGHVALDVAAAITYHAVQRSTKAISTAKDYSDALDIVASALAQVIPIYALESPREGRKRVAIDLARQSFAYGATVLVGKDATAVRDLTVMRSELWCAISRFRASGLPLFVFLATAAGKRANGARRNRLLAVLPLADYSRIEQHLELVPLRRRQVLYAEGERPRYVYFPLTAVLALHYNSHDGVGAAIALIGNDGMAGLRLVFGGESASLRNVVHIAGQAYRLPAEVLLDEFRRGTVLHDLLLRFMHALLMQIAQTAVCNRHHVVERQLCRWLLLYLDRLPSNEVLVTQEAMSDVLGVRRAGITKAATELQRAGLIRYTRGRIVVPDRKALEARGCECCAESTRTMRRLMVRSRTDLAPSI